MSLKRARYIHCPNPGEAPVTNGFSAEISPGFDRMHMDPGMCLFRITVCNAKDQFSRKQARIELAQKLWQEIQHR